MADERRLSIIPAPISRDPGLSDHAKLTAVAIGLFMDKAGRCHPGIEAIAKERGCSVRHAQRGIDELRERKHLSFQQRQRQSAVLEWLHPLTRQDSVRSNPLLTGQKKPLDRTESGALRALDRTDHVTRARMERGLLTSSLERGDKPVHSERLNSNSGRVDEMPVHDLKSRQHRAAAATPIRESLTRFLGPRDEKVSAS